LQIGDFLSDRFENPEEISDDVRIPESKNRHAARGKPSIANPIWLRFDSMLTTIEFDREPERGTIEVEDERPGWMLTPEVHAELPIAQLLPKLHFDIS
jgi:hypothetical protein